MTKKLNGMAKWIIVALALATVVFNSGVTYNHVRHLTKTVEKMGSKVDAIAEKINTINIKLAQK